MAFKKLAIIAALASEMEALELALNNKTEEKVGGAAVYTGTIGKYEIVLMQCGMGKVSAAAGAQALITAFKPDCVINTGCAGALDKELKVGDFVVANTTVEWDLDLITLGLPRGFVSALGKVEMQADERLSAWLSETIEKTGEKVLRGIVVSGDQFVDKAEQKKIITDAFPGALCAEMEGGAIGHVCVQNELPFCVIRSMSDTADGDSGVNFAEYSAAAGKKSAEILIHMLNN